MYESDITKFLQELKQQKPQLEAGQQRGRAIWWDRPQDLEVMRRHKESRLPQPGYVYYDGNYVDQ